MTLIVYCIVSSYKKNNIILLSVVSQVSPVRSTWTSIIRVKCYHLYIITCGFLSQALHSSLGLVRTCAREDREGLAGVYARHYICWFYSSWWKIFILTLYLVESIIKKLCWVFFPKRVSQDKLLSLFCDC